MVVHTLIPAPRRLKPEDCEFEARLGYTVRPCLDKSLHRIKSFTLQRFQQPHFLSAIDECIIYSHQSSKYLRQK